MLISKKADWWNDAVSYLSDNDEVIKLLTIIWMTKEQLVRKGFYQVLDAIEEIASQNKYNFVWKIGGGRGDGSELVKDIIKNRKLEKFVKLEFDLSNEEKFNLYADSDLYIQPSFYEGFGNAVLEAMSFGTPALVSGYASQPEVVKSSGFIVNQIDSDTIKNTILRFFNLNSLEKLKMREKTFEVIAENHLFEYRQKQFIKILNEDF